MMTAPYVELEGERILLRATFREKELCKLVPGARWDPKIDAWTLPVSWAACKILRGIFGASLAIGPKLIAWAQNEVATRTYPANYWRAALEADGDERLFPFQRAGVQFLLSAQHALLADEMGSGKTVQALAALRTSGDSLPALVICPNSMKMTWQEEIIKWWPEAEPTIITGGSTKKKKLIENLGDSSIAIINWESVRMHSRLAPYGSIRLNDSEKISKDLNNIPFRAVIADEAHRMKDPQTKQTRAVWAVGHQPSVQRRIALTGTPIANAIDDLWSVLHFLDPREWPSRTRYIDRYCLLGYNPFGGATVLGVQPLTRQEFFEIVDPRMRRMPKSVVLPFLPEKMYSRRHVDMHVKQARAYKQMKDQMLAQLESGDVIMSPNPISQVTRLVQFASACATLNDEGKLKLTAPSCKIDALLEVIDEVGPEEPLVVFAMSRQLIMLASEALTKAKVSHSLIVGGQTELERQTAISDFQAGRKRAVLCTIAAGGTGLTLIRARVCVFLQRAWSMVDNVQAEARVHRIGSEIHESVHIIDIVANGTIEKRMHDTMRRKGMQLEEIVRDAQLIRDLMEDE